MPTYLVTDPSTGKKIRLTGDSPPTDAELESIFSGMQTTEPKQAPDLPEIGAAPELNELSMPAFRSSFGLLAAGDDKAAQAVMQQQFPETTFENVDGATIANLPSGQYYLNRPGISGQDVIKTIFDISAFTPAGKAASIPGAILKSGLTETAIEAGEQSVGGEDIDPTDIVIAGGLGGLFKGTEDLIGAGYRALKGASPKSATEVIEAGAREGIPMMTTDVIPPKTFAGRMAQETGDKVPFFGTGGGREVQQQARVDAVERIADKYSQYSYKAITDSLKRKKDKIKSAAGNILNDVGKKLDNKIIGTGLRVKSNDLTIPGLHEQAFKNSKSIPIPETDTAIIDVYKELSKKGVIKSKGAISDITTLVEAIDEAPQVFTTLKENRTAFNDIIKGFDKAERSQLGGRSMSLLKRLDKAMKKDMDNFAKQNLSPKEYNSWLKANNVYNEEATKLTKSRLKNVLDKGDVTPESVSTLLFSAKPSEVKNLYSSLTPAGRSNGRAAIISKVIDNLSRRQSGVTPNSFATELKKYSPQVTEFFKGQDKKQLLGLQRVLEGTRRAQDAAVTTPTGQALIGAGTGLSAVTQPLETLTAASLIGGTARLYESAPVRNVLLKLASVPRGSTQFEKALREASAALQVATQSARRQQENTEQ